jgi:two-component system, LytTR family, response regulator
MKINCIVIDPHALQRINTISKINSHDALRFTNEFSTSTDALEFLEDNNTDLIFLEIDTPNLNGFEFLDLIKTTGNGMTKVIITTKNTNHAFKSYRYDVVDFLAKPLNESLFQNAIDKVLKISSSKEQNKETDTQHIFIKSNLKKRKVYIKDIKWIEALGDYVKLITNNGSFVILSTMKAFENELPSKKFLRIHKSYIINLKKVERYNSKFVEIENSQIPLSRNKKNTLTDALNVASSQKL